MAAARRSVLEVGSIVKPHGLRGGVVVRLVSDQIERIAPGATLQSDEGDLTVRASRALKDRFVVEFDGVETPEAAEALRDVVLYAAPIEKPGVLWVDEVVGATVRTVDGSTLGVVVGVEPNPASDLLALDSGVLIPSAFVRGELSDGVLTVELPEGLIE